MWAEKYKTILNPLLSVNFKRKAVSRIGDVTRAVCYFCPGHRQNLYPFDISCDNRVLCTVSLRVRAVQQNVGPQLGSVGVYRLENRICLFGPHILRPRRVLAECGSCAQANLRVRGDPDPPGHLPCRPLTLFIENLAQDTRNVRNILVYF